MSAPDVIVLGAGAAGLTVAREVTRTGLRVLVLEARNRLGGRIWTHHTPAGPVELGAEFVHGAVEEILGVAREAHLPLREIDRATQPETPRGSSPRGAAFTAIDTILAHARDGEDESFQHLVDRVGVDAPTKQRALMLVEGYHAADPTKLGVQSLLDNTAADERPGAERQFRWVQGYDGLVAALAAQAIPERCTVKLEAVVTALAWRPGHVVVRLATGEELTAPRVVVTVPLGVLKAGAIAFSPPLPSEKDAALLRLEMGATARVSLLIRDEAWPGRDTFAAESTLFTGRPPFPVWWISQRVPRPVVTGWGGRRGASALASLGEADRVGAAVRALAEALAVEPGRLQESVEGAFQHDWVEDPFARGAYSYAGVGGRRAGAELGAPIEGTLFFAGEATQSDGHNATVHGAIASGERAAGEVIGSAR
ncbi:MAG TPA: NAD(P)/FAD-dependent oxidoreductase [Polyangiaceae bacterium]|jgi:monoamine oxidase